MTRLESAEAQATPISQIQTESALSLPYPVGARGRTD